MAEFAPFTEAIDYTLATWRQAGAQAAGTLADLNTPGVLVVPQSLGDTTLDGSKVNVTLTVYLVAAGHDAAAVASLDELWNTGRRHGLVGVQAKAVSLTAPSHNMAGLPALETTINLEVERT